MNITITKKNEIKEILSIGQKEIQDFSFTEEDLNSYLDNENHILLSAVEDKVLKGFISARISGNEAEIDAVAVKSEYQHTGIGTELLKVLCEELENRKIDNLLIEVRRKNMNAFRFYKKDGFISYKVRPHYYEDDQGGDDAICMKKEIIKKEKEKVRRKNEIILAIETSCDETAIAIVKNGSEVIANTIDTQIEEHKKYGGVYPELATRLHLKNISKILSYVMTLKDFDFNTITHVAVTLGPGLPGALNIGIIAAKTIVNFIEDSHLVGVNHLAGHIYAGELVEKYKYPLIALVASGGNSEIVLMNEEMNFKILGQTIDDAVGEALDKIARSIGLEYPGGASIDKLVSANKDKDIPLIEIPKIHVSGYNLSYSGIKSHIIRLIEKEKSENNGKLSEESVLKYAYNAQKALIDQMIDKLMQAAKDYKIKNIVLGGGVSANSYLRQQIVDVCKKNKIHAIIPPLSCTTDNAVMIGLVASKKIRMNRLSKLDVPSDSSFNIEREGE